MRHMRLSLLILFFLLLVVLFSGPPRKPTSQTLSSRPSRGPASPTRDAIEKALPLLLKGAQGHIAKKTCFTCHNQALPILALTTARDRGFSLRDEDLDEQLSVLTDYLDRNRESYRKGEGQGGDADTAGYALLTLELGARKPNATTDAVVEYLLQFHKDADHWPAWGDRPPSVGSPFTTTYLALRALQVWGKPGHDTRVGDRIEGARAWLKKNVAKDTEDRVFRLLALQAAGVKREQLDIAAKDLLGSQRKDGGWGQLDNLDSDAYATGSALVALHWSGHLATTDPAYQRGVTFLLRTQQADGSWLVRSRSKPFQAYYESGFPHGKDQFISITATSWAITALVINEP